MQPPPISSAVGIRVFTWPGKGLATLYFFDGGKRRQGDEPSFAIEFKADPWRDTGLQPLAWEFSPPHGERTYSVITLVLDRSVSIVSALPDFVVLSATEPYIEIYRVQSPGLIPDEETPLDPSRLVAPPRRWKGQFWARRPEIEKASEEYQEMFYGEVLPGLTTAVVRPTPNGLDINHDLGQWSLTVRAPLVEAGAFAYELYHLEGVIALSPSWNIRIVCTKNVFIQFEKCKETLSHIEVAQTTLEAVPIQGSILDPKRFAFEPKDPDMVRLSPKLQRTRLLVEAFAGALPFIGATYDIAQFSYAACTGKDFWGATVNEDELLLLGVFALLPFAGSAVRTGSRAASHLKDVAKVGQALSKKITGANLKKLLDPKVLEELGRRMGPQLRGTLENLSDGAVERLSKLLGQHGTGQIPLSVLLAEFSGMLTESPVDELDYTPLSPAVLDLIDAAP